MGMISRRGVLAGGAGVLAGLAMPGASGEGNAYSEMTSGSENGAE